VSDPRPHAETVATVLQESFVPAIMPIEGFEIVGPYRVARRELVCRDFNDVIPTETGVPRPSSGMSVAKVRSACCLDSRHYWLDPSRRQE
jgi:hypothetical protein